MRVTIEAPLDRPDVVAEVRAAFDRYERALAAGDVATLTALFWDDPRCVRFGVADRQQGAAEIATWRAAHPTVPPGRRLHDTRVLAIDDATAMVTTLFGYPDGAVEGRQSQTWVRFPAGWRIVAAHVSAVSMLGSQAPRGALPMTATAPGRGAATAAAPRGPDSVLLAVVAAHRTGLPLHPELVALGARTAGVARTAPLYRLVALPGPGVPRGGLVPVGDGGTAIEVELHDLPVAAVGALVCALPAPLAIGRLELEAGPGLGLLCAGVPPGAVDVSAYGSWPAYLAGATV